MKLVASRLISAFSLGLASLLVSFTAFAQAEPATIVVYNAQHESLTQSWADAFTKETGIKVTLRNGGDTQLANQILQEGANSPADVFLTENSPAMALVDRAELFAPVAPATIALVQEAARPSNGRWVGIAARSTVFAYDKRKLSADKLPRSLMDLADPSWKGRWAASPSGADFQAVVSAMLELKGEQATRNWLVSMKQNATAYRGNSAAMKGVNAGEIEGAVIYHYYWFGDQAKTGENSANVGLHYFRNQDPGAFVIAVRRRRARHQQASCRSPGFPEVDRRQRRAGHPADRHVLRIRCRGGRQVERTAGAARRAAGSKDRSCEAQQPDRHRDDDGRRPALSLAPAQILQQVCAVL